MMTDPIADMLTRIRNAQMAKNSSCVVPFSKVKQAIADIFLAQGYLSKVEKIGETMPQLVLGLKYDAERQPAITSLKRESKPGHRHYCKAEDMPRILNDFGIAIVSTSRGIITNKDARKLKIGGEIICSIY